MNTLIPLLRLAGLMHLGFMTAGILMPKVTGIPDALRPLPPFIRNLFWMYYTFIGTCLLSFGLITFLFAPQLASGAPLARALCGFLALFWSVRVLFGTFVLDLHPYLNTPLRRTGYAVLNLGFMLLVPLYLATAILGGGA